MDTIKCNAFIQNLKCGASQAKSEGVEARSAEVHCRALPHPHSAGVGSAEVVSSPPVGAVLIDALIVVNFLTSLSLKQSDGVISRLDEGMYFKVRGVYIPRL